MWRYPAHVRGRRHIDPVQEEIFVPLRGTLTLLLDDPPLRVEVEPGGLRELHWHSNGDEWQYYISGKARMTVFGAAGNAATFDYQAGDVGYVPRVMPHYVENIGNTTMRFLELFRSDHFEDISLRQWLALTPHELVRAHLRINESVLAKIGPEKAPVLPP